MAELDDEQEPRDTMVCPDNYAEAVQAASGRTDEGAVVVLTMFCPPVGEAVAILDPDMADGLLQDLADAIQRARALDGVGGSA